MKNQYFGDQRDYFKFDLMIELATCVLEEPRFTNIVMLTPNVDEGREKGHGGAVDYPVGKRRHALHAFLQHHARLPRAQRKVESLRDYFATTQTDVEYLPFADHVPFFEGANRTAYFAGVQRSWVENAIVLVDPDVGLLPPKGKLSSCKHIAATELVQLKNWMGTSSVLVLFQFQWQGRTWQAVLDHADKSLRAQGHSGGFNAVYGDKLAFICLTNEPTLQTRVRECLERYARDNNDVSLTRR